MSDRTLVWQNNRPNTAKCLVEDWVSNLVIVSHLLNIRQTANVTSKLQSILPIWSRIIIHAKHVNVYLLVPQTHLI